MPASTERVALSPGERGFLLLAFAWISQLSPLTGCVPKCTVTGHLFRQSLFIFKVKLNGFSSSNSIGSMSSIRAVRRALY